MGTVAPSTGATSSVSPAAGGDFAQFDPANGMLAKTSTNLTSARTRPITGSGTNPTPARANAEAEGGTTLVSLSAPGLTAAAGGQGKQYS